jgi:hypothetical protein
VQIPLHATLVPARDVQERADGFAQVDTRGAEVCREMASAAQVRVMMNLLGDDVHGDNRARSHRCFAPLLVRLMPDSLTYSAPHLCFRNDNATEP